MEIPILFLRLRPAADSVLSVLDSHPQFEFEKVQQSSFSAFIFFMKTVRHCFSVRRCFINFLNDRMIQVFASPSMIGGMTDHVCL